MKNVKTQELVAGMVTANAIRTKSGQVVVGSKTALTPQLINHLKFYRIDEVQILSEFDSIENALNMTQPEILSYGDRIRSTIEYKHFKQTFSENVQFLSTQFNDVILKSDESRGHELLEQTTALFDALDDRVNIFEMLHCLRKTDVSTYTHSLNVAILCRLMGRWMHFSKEDVDTLTLCGL
ncbi:MAG: HD-GYP domain-containing protein, partial [Lachnospiraceae bacterium]|nr:HD-GYP domain-containing protein [Lachnospiraceae bacterium]